jgi:hypothetical protein
MNRTRMLALVLSLVLSPASAALACQAAGPNAHIGVVTAVGQNSLTLRDAESGMNLTFVATPEQIKGIAVKDMVTVVFSPEGDKLIAKSVKKG